MFVKCTACGYLTPESASLCKQCGVAVGPAPDPVVASGAAARQVDVGPIPPSTAPSPNEPPDGLAATMPPPDPATAAPKYTTPYAPAAPKAPTPPAMFPAPAARAARRSIPTWTVVSGTVALVAILIVGMIVVAPGTDNGAQRRVDAAQAAFAAQHAQIDAVEHSLMTRADFGSRWTDLGIDAVSAPDLRLHDACSRDPRADIAAKFGRSNGFSSDLGTDNSESGHATSVVMAYSSAAKARATLAARQQPSFAACIQHFDVAYLASPNTTDIVGADLTRTVTPGAIVYHETMHFIYQGVPTSMDFWTACFVHGAFRGTLSLSGQYAPAAADELVRVAKQRLDVHTPA